MEVLRMLLASTLLPLLPPSGASVPTLAPPLTMVVDGQRRQLVVCVVSDVPPGSGDAVWISSGNGSALQSFTYGASPEDGGTVCAVSILPESPLQGGLLACHVGPNSTAPARSSSPVPVTGRGEEAELCPSTVIGPRACGSAALLAAARVVLLKVALLDALLTSAIMAQGPLGLAVAVVTGARRGRMRGPGSGAMAAVAAAVAAEGPAALLLLLLLLAAAGGDDSDWVRLPSKCEVCKYVALELKSAFEETGKTKEVIDTKYGFLDGKGSAVKYTQSDIRLIEVTENICKRLLDYNLHKERSGSNRFAKGMSETFETLHNLVHKGVKVVMDIPYELWNETSAEVADLKKQCDVLVEEYEDVIEDWYRHHQTEDLSQFLCADHVLKGKDASCLAEKWTGKKGDLASLGEKPSKKKSGKKKKKTVKEQSEGIESLHDAGATLEEHGVQEEAPLPHSPADEL